MTAARPARPPRLRAAAALLLAGAGVAGCDAAAIGCPEIGWSNVLTVNLAADWPVQTGRTVHVTCSEPCGGSSLDDGGQGAELSSPLTGTSTSFRVPMTSPESVAVTVLDARGTPLARVDAEPDWVRVGGTEECGGPSEATVVVPAP